MLNRTVLELLSIDRKSPSEIVSNSTPDRLLTPAQCDEIYQKIASLRQYWLPRGSEDSLFCTLGAASYLDCGDYIDPEDTYWQKASRYNPLLLENFGWLYTLVKEYLETQLNAPVNYRFDAAYPCFHLWLAQAIPTLPVASMHFDDIGRSITIRFGRAE